jgi:ATP-dependent Lhr-like helicase
LAISNAGTIPDTGAFGVYLADGKTRIGELDEEFVFETRPGDAFLLGSSVWRVSEIGDDRVTVVDAAGATPRMPFWNGDYPYRPYDLGARIGRFRQAVVDRLSTSTPEAVEAWLRRDYALDERSARNLVAHVRAQLDAVKCCAFGSYRRPWARAHPLSIGNPQSVDGRSLFGRTGAQAPVDSLACL